MVDNWGFIAVLTLVAFTVPLIGLALSWLLRPHRPGPIKQTTYECGLETIGDSWVQFKVQYYLYALIFVLFDVETVFLYPWAVAAKAVGWLALVEMVIFIFILFMGFLYAHKKGALKWM